MAEGDESAKSAVSTLPYLAQRKNAVRLNADKELKKLQAYLDPSTETAIALVEASVGKIKKYLRDVQEIDMKLLPHCKESELAEKVQKSIDFEDNLTEKIGLAEAYIQMSRAKSQSQSHKSSAESVTSSEKASTVKLPKLQITPFSGDPLKWQGFWDSFQSSVHSNTSLAPVEKLQYLKEFLKEDALTIAEGYRMTDANYTAIVDMLKKRYGDPEVAVQEHLKALLALPPASGDISELHRVNDECEMHIRSLVALGLPEETFGRIFAPIILAKLPQHIRVELHRRNDASHFTLPKLRDLLQNELHARQMSKHVLSEVGHKSSSDTAKAKSSQGGRTKADKQASSTTSAFMTSEKPRGKQPSRSADPKPKRPCIFCKGSGHFPDQCSVYPDAESRKATVKGSCQICLRSDHSTSTCRLTKQYCYFCKERHSHHRSLCPVRFPRASIDSTLSVDAADFVPRATSLVSPSYGCQSQRGVAIMQTALATVKGAKASARVRVLLDSASTRSFCRTDILRRVGAKNLGSQSLAIAGLESEGRKHGEYLCAEIELLTTDGIPLSLQVNAVKSISCPIEKQAIDPRRHPILRKIQLADPISDKPKMVQVDILVGLDAYYSLVGTEQVRLDSGLVLLGTRLGYVAAGCLKDEDNAGRSETVMIASILSPEQRLYDVVQRFWQLESIGISDPTKGSDDDLVQNMFNQTVQFNSLEGRYEVRFPFRPQYTELPDNYDLALGRLRSLVKRLTREPKILQAYHETILQQLSHKVIEEIPQKPDGSRVHYIPHHCIVNTARTTTKLRVVYDASAKSSKLSPSLNDSLLRGPVYLADMCGLLIRFRFHPIGISSDIEKAFHQVGLNKADRDVVRFIWLRIPSKGLCPGNLVVYRFARVPFGAVSSPFLLAATIRHHMIRLDTETASDIVKNSYVDNVVTGKHSEQEALTFYRESKASFQQISMNLREWFSNSRTFLESVPEVDRGSGSKTKVLGIPWDLEADSISCPVGRFPLGGVCTPTTKRSILQANAGLFDPCGYFSPVSIKGKLLLQELWQLNSGWDDPAPSDIQTQWAAYSTDLRAISAVRLPRYIGIISESSQIHCFCDASLQAYGAAVYIVANDSGNGCCNLVFSKGRVRPIKAQTLTIPRLELTALTLATRLIRYIRSELNMLGCVAVAWTDSQCSLDWVESNASSPVFIHNRVREIRKTTSEGGITLRYVPSEENPADILSRGSTLAQLENNIMWWHGPPWLLSSQQHWPAPTVSTTEVSDPSDIHEMSTEVLLASDVPPQLLPVDRFSSLRKLLRVTAYVLRFVKMVRDRPSATGGHLQGSEILEAKRRWIQSSQSVLSNGSGILKGTIVRQLGLFRDSSGLIRCSGRLDYADLPYDAKYPLILPKNAAINRLLIADVHERLGHAGLTHVLAELRTELWMVNARSQIKAVLRSCLTCRRVGGGRFRIPDGPPLPSFRLDSGKTYACTGLDYAGPLFIKTDRSPQYKVWICLFTCAVSRAVHLEVVTDMSAQQFLLALRRFMSLYGKPDIIVCDNAKTFKSSNNVMDKLFASAVAHDDVQGEVSNLGITWKFIVELAPWMGGFYERMVGLVKTKLKCIIRSRLLSLVELQTVCAEVAGIINSRPLAYCEDEVGARILTPNLLIGRNRPGFPPVSQAERDDPDYHRPLSSIDNLVSHWRHLQTLSDQFWTSWRNEYMLSLRDKRWLPSLRGLSKLGPKVGGVVLVKEAHMPRGQWKCGRILELSVGRDGETRSAKILLPNRSVIQRPLKLLFPLEIPDDPVEIKGPVKTEQPGNTDVRVRPTRQSAIKARQKIAELASLSSDEGDS